MLDLITKAFSFINGSYKPSFVVISHLSDTVISNKQCMGLSITESLLQFKTTLSDLHAW